MFAVRFLKNANRQFRKLDPPVARRMIARLEWLSEHFEEITPEPLSRELAGLFKYREGDYRILYEPLHAERLIIIHEIGHRREVYKKRRTWPPIDRSAWRVSFPTMQKTGELNEAEAIYTVHRDSEGGRSAPPYRGIVCSVCAPLRTNKNARERRHRRPVLCFLYTRKKGVLCRDTYMSGLSYTALFVLQALDRGYRFGFDIMDATGLPSGTVYPALRRLESTGLVVSDWEDDGRARKANRPRRRYYQLTKAGRSHLSDAEMRYRAVEKLFAKGSRA